MSMTTTTTGTEREVDGSFCNDDCQATLTIQTKKVDFLVHTWPIRHRSKVFKDMLSLPQIGVDDTEQYFVLRVPEPADIIRHLLCSIYEHQKGAHTHKISDGSGSDGSEIHEDLQESLTKENICEFIRAARKYEIHHAIRYARWFLRELSSSDPIFVYSVSKTFNLEKVSTFSLPQCVLLPLNNPILFRETNSDQALTVKDFQYLLHCKGRRAESASHLLVKYRRLTMHCGRCNQYGCTWFKHYLFNARRRLEQRPTSDILLERELMDSILMNECPEEEFTLRGSQPFFTVIRMEIDSLPWEYDTSGAFEMPLTTARPTYAGLDIAVDVVIAARRASQGNEVDGMEEDEEEVSDHEAEEEMMGNE